MSEGAPTISIGQLSGALYVALRGGATQRTCPTVDHVVNAYLGVPETAVQPPDQAPPDPPPGGAASDHTPDAAASPAAESARSRPADAKRIIIDLSGCEWIDSTFGGWLIGLARRLQRAATSPASHSPAAVPAESNPPSAAHALTLANVGPACRESLEKMHLAALFDFHEVKPPARTHALRCPRQETGAAALPRDELELMLRAHEELAAVDDFNARIFGPIAEMLRQQLNPR